MATTITKTEKLVGKRIRRREDPRLITGTATYVDDIQMPGMHHACIVRSPHAAARIKSHRHQAGARTAGRGRGLHRQRYRRSGSGSLRRIAARPARSASSYPGHRSRLFRRPPGGRRGGHRPVHRARRRRPIEVDYEPLPAVADPEKAIAPGAPRGASGVARQHGLHIITRKAATSTRHSPKPKWW